MNVAQSSLRSATLLNVLTLAQFVLQFGLQIVLAKLFGAAEEMDAFVSAMTLPTIVAGIMVGSLGAVLVPRFLLIVEQRSDAEGWQLASQIGALAMGIATLAALLGSLTAEPLMQTLQPGFDAATVELTARLFRILAWLLVANTATAWLFSLQTANGRFLLPGLAGVLGVSATLAYVLALGESRGIVAVAEGVLLGGVVNVALQAKFVLLHCRQIWPLHAEVPRVLALLFPIWCGSVYVQIDPLVDRYLGSMLAEGSLSHLGYAFRLRTAVVTLATSGLSIVVFPVLARLSAADRREELCREVAAGIRFLLVGLIPLLVAAAVIGRPTIRLLFERGAFTAVDTAVVWGLLMWYAGAIVGTSLGELTSKLFYARGDTRTPVTIGVLVLTGVIALKFGLVRVMGVDGLAFGASLSAGLAMIIQTVIHVRQLGPAILADVGATTLRATACSGVAALAAAGIVNSGTVIGPIFAAAAGGIIYVVTMLLLRDEFAVRAAKLISDLVVPRRPK